VRTLRSPLRLRSPVIHCRHFPRDRPGKDWARRSTPR
jgi:hypothetical protein